MTAKQLVELEPITDNQAWKLIFIARAIKGDENKELREILENIMYKEPAMKIIRAWYDLVGEGDDLPADKVMTLKWHVDQAVQSFAYLGYPIINWDNIKRTREIMERARIKLGLKK